MAEAMIPTSLRSMLRSVPLADQSLELVYKAALQAKDWKLMKTVAETCPLGGEIDQKIKDLPNVACVAVWVKREGRSIDDVKEMVKNEKRIGVMKSLADLQELDKSVYVVIAERGHADLTKKLLQNYWLRKQPWFKDVLPGLIVGWVKLGVSGWNSEREWKDLFAGQHLADKALETAEDPGQFSSPLLGALALECEDLTNKNKVCQQLIRRLEATTNTANRWGGRDAGAIMGGIGHLLQDDRIADRAEMIDKARALANVYDVSKIPAAAEILNLESGDGIVLEDTVELAVARGDVPAAVRGCLNPNTSLESLMAAFEKLPFDKQNSQTILKAHDDLSYADLLVILEKSKLQSEVWDGFDDDTRFHVAVVAFKNWAASTAAEQEKTQPGYRTYGFYNPLLTMMSEDPACFNALPCRYVMRSVGKNYYGYRYTPGENYLKDQFIDWTKENLGGNLQRWSLFDDFYQSDLPLCDVADVLAAVGI